MKILAIHDLAGFGRCSLTTVIGVLARYGHQCIPAPTAIFSTHTAIENYKKIDLTDFLPEYLEHYKSLNLHFEAIYSGFLASSKQIDSVLYACKNFEESFVIIDPVMGDNDKIYKTYTKEMCEKMKELVQYADILTPNLTEVKILLDMPLDTKIDTAEALSDACKKLNEMGAKNIVVTGILVNEETVGTAFYQNSALKMYEHEYIDVYYPGTGDLFTSILIAKVLKGESFESSIIFASDFVKNSINYSILLGTNPLYGVEFEKLL
ncbi:MAG: pyridoxamine kinase [Clostridia bacterium]